MKATQDPQVLEAMARRLAVSKREPKVVILGQARKREAPRQRSVMVASAGASTSQSARAQFGEAIAAAARRRARPEPIATPEIRAQRTRRVEALVAALKRERGVRA